jgi:hypothetical protein
MNRNMKPIALSVIFAALTLAIPLRGEAAPRQTHCRKFTLTGEVNAGQEWRATIGEGWVFRVLPVQPPKDAQGPAYSGWDLVVDRDQPAGFPDALLLATPPYNSISEREVGTTFGLRAQDAIGWNPRSFHFLTDPDALRESQRLFQIFGGIKPIAKPPAANSQEATAIQRQLKINQKSSPGEFRILNARLAPGVSDAAPYAENWALASTRTPHKFEPPAAGKSSPLGEFHWMQFSIVLWLPGAWKTPKGIQSTPAACPE